jgi:hypothetical protein
MATCLPERCQIVSANAYTRGQKFDFECSAFHRAIAFNAYIQALIISGAVPPSDTLNRIVFVLRRIYFAAASLLG